MAWGKISVGDLDVSELDALVKTITDILDAVVAVLQLFVATLNILAAFLLLATNLIDAIVNAAIAVIEQTLLDLLQNNAAAALHINMNWNPAWRWKRKPHENPQRVVDFYNDHELPYFGTGVGGWLLDLSASTGDPTDRFRPLTDADTKVTATLFVKGIPANGNLQNLITIFEAFTQWGDKKEMFNFADELSALGESRQILDRFGPAIASSFMADTVGGLATIPADFLGLFDSNLSEFLPTPGSYPKWIAAPVALLIPPIGKLIELIKAVADALRADISSFDNLQKIIAFLERRAQLLIEAAEELQGLIETIAGIILFFVDTYVYHAKVETGGFAAFVNGALAAEGIPDYGERGLVVGVCLMSTQDDPTNHIENFLSLVGLQLQDYADDVTARSAELEQAWGSYFP